MDEQAGATVRVRSHEEPEVGRCEFCGGVVHLVLFFHGKGWLRCQDCGHDQAGPQ